MIFKLQRKTDLALAALRHLGANEEEPLSGLDLADAIDTSMSFLPQIMSPLVRAGWVVSERGPGGGYRLSERSASATLYDVIEATEGPTNNGRCVMRDGPCPGKDPCQIHFVADEARTVLADGFRRISAIGADQGDNQ